MIPWNTSPYSNPGWPVCEKEPDLLYGEWIEMQGLGKIRWYLGDEEGNPDTTKPRTYYELEDNWKKIWDIATRTVDEYFFHRKILFPEEFTDDFIARVPMAWQKMRTTLEMMTDLYGLSIDPEEFYAGYDRETDRTENVTTTNDIETATEKLERNIEGERIDVSSMSGNVNQNIGQRIDSGKSTVDGTQRLGERTTNNNGNTTTDTDNRTRDELYAPGTQAYEGQLGDNTIGRLGGDYIESLNDHVNISNVDGSTSNIEIVSSQNNSTNEVNDNTLNIGPQIIDTATTNSGTNNKGRQENSTEGDSTITTDQDGTRDSTFHETVKERRVNAYDKIAYARLRMDFINQVKNFYEYFDDLFIDISGGGLPNINNMRYFY